MNSKVDGTIVHISWVLSEYVRFEEVELSFMKSLLEHNELNPPKMNSRQAIKSSLESLALLCARLSDGARRPRAVEVGYMFSHSLVTQLPLFSSKLEESILVSSV